MFLRIGGRSTALAKAQSKELQVICQSVGIQTELVTMKTKGDLIQGALPENGGKGLFLKEVEEALLSGEIDCAVHSYKDIPFEETEGLVIAGVLKRKSPEDVFLSRDGSDIEGMPKGAAIGSSSARRKMQAELRYPHLDVQDVRGGVLSRIKKMDDGEFDGLILALAGLERLGIEGRVSTSLSCQDFVPAVGQGALALQARSDNQVVCSFLKSISDADTEADLLVERSFLKALEGTCETPLGGIVRRIGKEKHFFGFLGKPETGQIIRKKWHVCQDKSLKEQGANFAVQIRSELEKSIVCCG